jgi:hypothetical protein
MNDDEEMMSAEDAIKYIMTVAKVSRREAIALFTEALRTGKIPSFNTETGEAIPPECFPKIN